MRSIEFEIELNDIKVTDWSDGRYFGGVGIVSLNSDGEVEVYGFGQDQDGGDHDIGDVTHWYSSEKLKQFKTQLLELDCKCHDDSGSCEACTTKANL